MVEPKGQREVARACADGAREGRCVAAARCEAGRKVQRWHSDELAAQEEGEARKVGRVKLGRASGAARVPGKQMRWRTERQGRATKYYAARGGGFCSRSPVAVREATRASLWLRSKSYVASTSAVQSAGWKWERNQGDVLDCHALSSADYSVRRRDRRVCGSECRPEDGIEWVVAVLEHWRGFSNYRAAVGGGNPPTRRRTPSERCHRSQSHRLELPDLSAWNANPARSE